MNGAIMAILLIIALMVGIVIGACANIDDLNKRVKELERIYDEYEEEEAWD